MESFVSEKFLAVTQSMDLTEREMLALLASSGMTFIARCYRSVPPSQIWRIFETR